MRISGGISLCVLRRFSLFMPSHQIHIYLRLLEQPRAVRSRWKLARQGRKRRISLTGLFAILMSVYNVTWCIALAPRTYLHGFMGIVPGPREKERERDREEHFAADHTALEIALESGWILYARCREAVKCISLCINSNLE
jgi:hypothetical protein